MNKDIELLSSYLDGELSPEEIKLLEEKLSYTSELRDKLAELKRVKELTRSSIKKIAEAPYFETRLFSYLEEKPYGNKIKKWSPVIGVSVLTVTLMLLLKFNPDFIENIFEEQKSNLAGFYKENLKPLLFAADLSNEDIFNFAFYNQLPLDNTKTQYIQLGSDPSGDEYFEISTAGLITEEGNLKKFIETLDLNENQKQQFDSIMGSYAVALQSQILVNDKNTVAISPNLWNYQKAIVADILSFAKDYSPGITNAIPVIFNVQSPVVEQVVHSVKTNNDNEYIFFTPDSLFMDTFDFDDEEFKKEMEIAKREIQYSFREIHRSQKEMEELNLVTLKLDSSLIKLKRAPRVDKNINIFIDSNVCRVQINKIEIPDIDLPDMDNLEEIINEATKEIKAFTFTVPKFDLPDGKAGKKFHNYDYKIKIDDSSNTYDFDVHIPEIPEIDSIIEHEMKNLHNFNLPDGKAGWNGAFPNDSLSKWFNFFRYDDSTYSGNPQHFEFRMKEFEEEMEKFKEEMEKLKKEIRKDSVRVKPC